MARKIIQISALPASDSGYAIVYALCDDGTVWESSVVSNRCCDWEKLPDIPKEQKEYTNFEKRGI